MLFPSTSTGTVPFGDAANIEAGLSFNRISLSSHSTPLIIMAKRARMA